MERLKELRELVSFLWHKDTGKNKDLSNKSHRTTKEKMFHIIKQILKLMKAGKADGTYKDVWIPKVKSSLHMIEHDLQIIKGEMSTVDLEE